MTEGEITSTISRLSSRIGQIQVKIEHINAITDEAISKLETQKRELRTFHPNYSILHKNIQQITVDHDQVLNRLLTKQTHVKARKASLDQLDFTVAQLDREISRIQADRDRVLFELNKKREEIVNALKSTESLTIQIQQLNTAIGLLTENHEEEMQQLEHERQELANRTDLTDSEKELALAELDRQMMEKEEMYKQHIKSLEQQRDESLSMIKDFTAEEAMEMKDNLLNEIDDLEAMKVGASPSEVEAINKKIAALKNKMEDLEILGELRERGLALTPSGRIRTASGTIYTIEEATNKGLLDGINVAKLLLDDKLREKGLSMTKSGKFRTRSGKILSLQETKDMGLLDADTMDLLHSSRKSSLSGSSESLDHLSSQDVSYLKMSVGKPLTLALAEICMKQPRDPIHYLGHWLFKYRYNQEIDEVKKREVEQLIAERERIRLEAWHREVEDAAKSAVLEMVFRAHDEAMQRELTAQTELLLAAEGTEEGGEEENDELAEEAKDVLGEYTGPPAGQRRI